MYGKPNHLEATLCFRSVTSRWWRSKCKFGSSRTAFTHSSCKRGPRQGANAEKQSKFASLSNTLLWHKDWTRCVWARRKPPCWHCETFTAYGQCLCKKRTSSPAITSPTLLKKPRLCTNRLKPRDVPRSPRNAAHDHGAFGLAVSAINDISMKNLSLLLSNVDVQCAPNC